MRWSVLLAKSRTTGAIGAGADGGEEAEDHAAAVGDAAAGLEESVEVAVAEVSLQCLSAGWLSVRMRVKLMVRSPKAMVTSSTELIACGERAESEAYAIDKNTEPRQPDDHEQC